MITFRQKIFIAYLVVFVSLIAILFPFANRTVKQIAKKAMDERANELIANIKNSRNKEALVRKLKEQKALIYFRVAVITNENKVIYDSHAKRILGEKFSPEFVVEHPEVLEAFEKGTGYHEEYSNLLNQKFAYFAKSFLFQGRPYVLRIAFPLSYVEQMSNDFEMGILGSVTLTLLLFSLITWFLINYLTRPIKQIITAVKPYQEGETDAVPTIKLTPEGRSDEFGKLANTLNSLSISIRDQIQNLTEERNEKESVLESLIEGVVSVDSDLVVEFANAAALKFLNVDPKDLLNRPFTPDIQERCYHLLKRCQEEKMIITETQQIKHDGEKTYLNIVAAPTKGDIGAILVLHDTTEHHRIIEMRKDFIANASHELKTPITIIRGFAETLHDNPDLPKETVANVTAKIVNNCERMAELIKDLLTLTDIERLPESRLYECDLVDLIQACVETSQELHPDAKIKIEKKSERDFHLLLDPNLIEGAITNLLTNAARYSEPPADITIRLDYEEEWIKIEVADKGIGIPKEDLKHIFQRFYTVDKARSQKVGGSGLGLSIVEMVIAKHFGKISVNSKVGEGTTFIILLPTHQPIKE